MVNDTQLKNEADKQKVDPVNENISLKARLDQQEIILKEQDQKIRELQDHLNMKKDTMPKLGIERRRNKNRNNNNANPFITK